MTTMLHLISSLLLVFNIQQSTALNDVESISVKIYDGSTSDTTGQVTITLWFNFTIYQYTLPATTVGATFIAYKSALPSFTTLGSSDCHLPSYNNIPEAKVMIQNNNNNAVIIDRIKFTTSSGDWFGFDSICIYYNQNSYSSNWKINDNECGSFYEHYVCVCVDNDWNDCHPYKQIIYFDTSRPNTYITNAQWSDGSSVTPRIKTCNPTKSPTHFPTQFPTLNPTKTPTNSPVTAAPTTRAPTISPITNAPTAYPTINPSVTPTISPTNIPTISPITNAPTYKPTEFPTLTPTNKQDGSVNNVLTTDNSDVTGDGKNNLSIKQNNNSNSLLLIIIAISICICLCICIFVIYARKRKREIRRAKSLGTVFGNNNTKSSQMNIVEMESPVASINTQPTHMVELKSMPSIPNMNSNEDIMEDITMIAGVTPGNNSNANSYVNTKGGMEAVADDTDEGTGTDEDGMEIDHIVKTAGGENSNDYGNNVPPPPPPPQINGNNNMDEDSDVVGDIEQRYETVGK